MKKILFSITCAAAINASGINWADKFNEATDEKIQAYNNYVGEDWQLYNLLNTYLDAKQELNHAKVMVFVTDEMKKVFSVGDDKVVKNGDFGRFLNKLSENDKNEFQQWIYTLDLNTDYLDTVFNRAAGLSIAEIKTSYGCTIVDYCVANSYDSVMKVAEAFTKIMKVDDDYVLKNGDFNRFKEELEKDSNQKQELKETIAKNEVMSVFYRYFKSVKDTAGKEVTIGKIKEQFKNEQSVQLVAEAFKNIMKVNDDHVYKDSDIDAFFENIKLAENETITNQLVSNMIEKANGLDFIGRQYFQREEGDTLAEIKEKYQEIIDSIKENSYENELLEKTESTGKMQEALAYKNKYEIWKNLENIWTTEVELVQMKARLKEFKETYPEKIKQKEQMQKDLPVKLKALLNDNIDDDEFNKHYQSLLEQIDKGEEINTSAPYWVYILNNLSQYAKSPEDYEEFLSSIIKDWNDDVVFFVNLYGSFNTDDILKGITALEGRISNAVLKTSEGEQVQKEILSSLDSQIDEDSKEVIDFWLALSANGLDYKSITDSQARAKIQASADKIAAKILNHKKEKINQTNAGMLNIQLNNMNKRLGEVRALDGTYGAWLRSYGGSYHDVENNKIHYYSTQIGADKKISLSKADLILGGYFGFDKINADTKSSGFNAALYASYLFDNGFFVDAVAKFSRASFKQEGWDYNHRNIFLASLEGGYRFDFTNFYIEPSFELISGHISTLKAQKAQYEYINNAFTPLIFKPQLYLASKAGDLTYRLGFGGVFEAKKQKASLEINNLVSGLTAHSNERLKRNNYGFLSIGGSYKINDNLRFNLNAEKNFGGILKHDYELNATIRYTF